MSQIPTYSLRQEALRYLLSKNPVDRNRAADRIVEIAQVVGAKGRVLVLVQNHEGSVIVTANRVNLLTMNREDVLTSAKELQVTENEFLPLAILEGTYANSFSATTML